MGRELRLRAVALLAVVGLFVALYLLLYALGYYGALLCGPGSCDVVQASRYARFLGFPVPAWGVGWYGAVAATSLLALHSRFVEARWPGPVLAVLATTGVLFSAYLTYVEVFLIGAICLWCVVSAVLTVLVFALARPWRPLSNSG